jgi:NAD(P)-dependent dehydrogenase (short-subunit alcohol dehydrogenase family)
VAGEVARSGGIPVIGCLENEGRARSLAAALETRYGVRVPIVAGDVLDGGVRERLLEAAASSGALYGLVPLVGAPARVRLEEASEDDFLASTRVNLVAPVLLARDFAAARGRADASVVFVSTMQAVGVFPGSALYAGPKAALIHTARILAKEWGGHEGIRVNVVAPGVTTSGMAEASVRSGKYDGFVRDGVIPRLGLSRDIARAIGLLLEPDNYITGQVLTIDGGLTSRM